MRRFNELNCVQLQNRLEKLSEALCEKSDSSAVVFSGGSGNCSLNQNDLFGNSHNFSVTLFTAELAAIKLSCYYLAIGIETIEKNHFGLRFPHHPLEMQRYSAKILSVISGSSFSTAQGTVVLSGVECPRQQQPFNFQAREFLRSKMAGKTVVVEEVKVLKEQPKTVAANVYIGSSFVNVEVMKAGFAHPRDGPFARFCSNVPLDTTDDALSYAKRDDVPAEDRIMAAHVYAKLAKKGQFDDECQKLEQSLHIIEMTSKGPELAAFIEKFQNKENQGYIEHIRDSDSFYCILRHCNDYYKFVATPFAIQCVNPDLQLSLIKEFLHRNATIRIISNPQSNLVAVQLQYNSAGEQTDLSAHLLDQRSATAVEWMIKNTPYAAQYSEFLQKEAPKPVSQPTELLQRHKYRVKVSDVTTADSLTILFNGEEHKIFLASIISPKCNAHQIEQYGVECKQYLRSFYDKTLLMIVEYIRELDASADNQLKQTRIYASFYDDGENICFALVRKGLCRVLKHKMSDSNRSSDYNQLVELEQEPAKEKLNFHGTVNAMKVSDISSLALNELKVRATQLGSQKATIEHVMTGGKMRCMLLNNFNTNQVNFITITPMCCKVPSVKKNEFYADMATEFLKQYLFKQVTIQFVGGLEKYTNAFNCLITLDQEKSVNFQMLEKGFAKFIPNQQADNQLVAPLKSAEARARASKTGLHSNQVDLVNIEYGSFDQPSQLSIICLDVTTDYGEIIFRTADSVFISEKLNSSSPLDNPKIGQLCFAEYLDKLHRARIDRAEGHSYEVYFIDAGVKQNVSKVFTLPENLQNQPALALVTRLAFINHQLKYKFETQKSDFIEELRNNCLDKTLNAFFCGLDEYGVPLAFIQAKNGEMDIYNTINSFLLEEGLTKLQEARGGESYYEQMAEYEQSAANANKGCWA